jgi:hypothetical protein
MQTTTRRAVWILSWVLAGCGSGAFGADSVPANAPPTLAVAPPLIAEEAQIPGRLIGLKKDSSTPCRNLVGKNSTGWTVTPMFAARDGFTDSRARGLAAFCLYDHERNGPIREMPQLTDQELNSLGLSRLDPDYLALARSGEGTDVPFPTPGIDSMLWRPQEAHFLEQTGQAQLPLATGESPRVRLAILDTQPTGKRAPKTSGQSMHGFTLAHIARHLVCNDNGRCAATIAPELALSVTSFQRQTVSRDTKRGGYLGTVGDLARAIVLAIAHWDKDRDPDGKREEHLVLNLSLGWDGALFRGLEGKVSDMPAPMQAVYRALEYAASRDVLVIAAAGNGRLGPQPGDGPLLPAAWETRVSPSGPLVYAAGGVQSDGLPLANARRLGTPPRVAYAEEAVVEGPKANQPTAIYTGTSVSAAVVSSVAAAVWHFRPELDRQELMELLQRSGNDLGRQADFSSPVKGGPVPTVRRISLCPALASACQRGEGSCPRPTKLPVCQAWDPRPVDLRPRLSQMEPNRVLDATQLTRKMEVRGPCSVKQVLFAQKEPEVPCPIEQLHDIAYRPWTEPQPPDYPCPNCFLIRQNPPTGDPAVEPSYELAIGIKSTRGHCLKSLDLYLDDTSHHWDFKDNELCEGSTLAVSGLRSAKLVSSAKLVLTEFTLEDKPAKAEVTILQ